MAQEKWLVDPGQSKTIDLEVVRKLKLGLIGGQVDIIGHDEPGARVEVHSVTGKDLKITIDGDTLEIDHPQLSWNNFIDVFRAWNGKARADVSVLVPRDIALKFGVVSADGLISGLKTDAELSTVSGALTVDEVVGDLTLNAVSGELSVRNHVGRIVAHTVSGDVTVNGTLRRFSSDAVSGNVFLDIDGTPEEITTNSVSGDLTIRMDAGVPSRYRVNTLSGRLQLDDSSIRGTMGKTVTHTYGTLEGEWVEVSSNSVSGNISVVRRAPTAGAEANTDASGASA